MPLHDVTLDTNVLLHSCNPIEVRQSHCINLISTLLLCDTKLTLDYGFSTDPAKNRSLIGAEYLQNVVPGSLPAEFLIHLARNDRILMVKASIETQLSKKINKLVA